MVISGMGAGFNELIALAGTSELVPIRKRGIYVACVVFTILPFCPSPMWAQLIAISNWRWIGLLVGIWNLIGLILVTVFYRDPPKVEAPRPKREILREIDYIGGFLSTSGVVCFMMGMQWGANEVSSTRIVKATAKQSPINQVRSHADNVASLHGHRSTFSSPFALACS